MQITLQGDAQCCCVVGVVVLSSIFCQNYCDAMRGSVCVCFRERRPSCLVPHFAMGEYAVLLVLCYSESTPWRKHMGSLVRGMGVAAVSSSWWSSINMYFQIVAGSRITSKSLTISVLHSVVSLPLKSGEGHTSILNLQLKIPSTYSCMI